MLTIAKMNKDCKKAVFSDASDSATHLIRPLQGNDSSFFTRSHAWDSLKMSANGLDHIYVNSKRAGREGDRKEGLDLFGSIAHSIALTVRSKGTAFS